MRDIISYYFFLLVIYSFVGWVWESVFCSLYAEHRLINRGFLNGPYCPIYGTGAIFGLITLSGIENPILLFFAAAVLTCTLEYFTSWAMEKLFHARWWDYSDEPLNINGRVYIGGFIAFGLGVVALIKVINPFVTKLILRIPYNIFSGICAVLATVIIVDFAVTLSGLAGFGEKLRDLTAALEGLKDTVSDKLDTVSGKLDSVTEKLQNSAPIETMKEAITGSVPYEKATELYERFADMLSTQQKRIINAFPKMKTVRYTKAFSELKKHTLLKRSKAIKK